MGAEEVGLVVDTDGELSLRLDGQGRAEARGRLNCRCVDAAVHDSPRGVLVRTSVDEAFDSVRLHPGDLEAGGVQKGRLQQRLTVIRGVVIVVHIAPIERLLAACGNGPSGRLSSQLSISRFDGGQSRSPHGSGRSAPGCFRVSRRELRRRRRSWQVMHRRRTRYSRSLGRLRSRCRFRTRPVPRSGYSPGRSNDGRSARCLPQ